MTKPPNIILAIEAAIAGGSISLLKGGIEVASWVGASSVSRAEDLLGNIDLLLADSNIPPGQIDLLAVSAGPGSFTGIRIGIATALGLKAGLGVRLASESVLKAMAFSHTGSQDVIAAAPVGRNAVCWQVFEKLGEMVEAAGEPQTMTDDEFLTFVNDQKDRSFALHGFLYEKAVPRSSLADLGYNLASAVGRICAKNPEIVAGPLFISKTF